MRLLFLLLLVLQAFVTIFTAAVYEGEDTSLAFQESLEETSLYTILFNDVIINENGSPVEGSLPAEQLSRFQIRAISSSGLIHVQINIQQTDRSDAGTYTLHGNPATDSFIEENMDLVVFYAPSNPECNIANNTMTCSATQGNPSGGMISCYQGGNKLQNILQVAENSSNIQAKYTVEDTSLGCCTESSSFITAPGNCTQFVWHASPGVQTTLTTNSTKNITIPVETTRISTTSAIPLETDILYIDDWLAGNRVTLGFVCGILFVLLILYPFGMIYHFKVYMREPKKYVSDSKGRGHFTPVTTV